MDLKVIGSSSGGNCYILDNGCEALLIECGMPWRNVQTAVDFDISRVKGAIISHEHGDHCRYVRQVAKARIPVYASESTAKNTIFVKPKFTQMQAFKKIAIGNFTVMPFDVQHDADEPFGFLIHHPEMGLTLFATDTYYLKYTFNGLNNIMIECNYQAEILNENVANGIVSAAQKNRTLQSHMSLQTCIDTLKANNLAEVANIVLIHLSPNNANPDEFRTAVAKATGGNVHVASPGLVIPFNKYEF